MLALTVPGVLMAADAAGVWQGGYRLTAAPGAASATPLVVKLHNKDGQWTGSSGPSAEKQKPFDSVAVEDGVVTLRRQERGRTLVMELRVQGDRLAGRMNYEKSPQQYAAEVYLTRKK